MKTSLTNISSNFVNALSQFVISIAVSKLFSPELYGEFVYISAIAFMLSVLFNFGYTAFGLVFLSKRYFNILRLLINYSYFAVILIVVVSTLFGQHLLALAGIYVFTITLKELFNNSLVVSKELGKKARFNFLDLGLILFVFGLLYILKIENHVILVLFAGLAITKTASIFYLIKNESFQILKPLPALYSLKKFNVFFGIARYNSLNVLFTALYTQGYYILIGHFLSFTEVSLVKYINLIQNSLNIVTLSIIQQKNHFLRDVETKLKQLKTLILSLFGIQITGSVLSVFVIYYFNVFEWIFDLEVNDYLFVLMVLLGYTFTPLKQVLGVFLTSKNLFKQRTNSIIISVALAFPILFLLPNNLYFLVAYFLLVDIIAVLLFTKNLSKWRS